MPHFRIPPPTPESLESLRAILEPKAKRALTELELRESYWNLMGYGLVAVDIARERAEAEARAAADVPDADLDSEPDGFRVAEGRGVQKSPRDR